MCNHLTKCHLLYHGWYFHLLRPPVTHARIHAELLNVRRHAFIFGGQDDATQQGVVRDGPRSLGWKTQVDPWMIEEKRRYLIYLYILYSLILPILAFLKPPWRSRTEHRTILRFTASFWRHNLQRVSSSSRAFAATAWWKLKTFKRRWYPQQSGGLHYKVDMNYHLFFALAILICNATWSKHCGKVQKYTCKVQCILSRYKSARSTYKSILSTCKIILSKYKKILAKYKLSIYIYTFKVHQTQRCTKEQLSEPWQRNLRNPEPS